ncbi:amidase [Roseibacterium sp. SDUM158016]|uniref:amidase n=1 Tax=Roseicyclus sediminis TaxID=2980997 RepID=UPI0021D0405C|nr:amidase [Roseibacterium sp. SDUM158016]MCU4652071.1 amidase [Roseibacterium sp. SDUM158016]
MSGLVETADAIRRGETTAEAETRAAFARLEAAGRSFNAVAALDLDAALEQAGAVDKARAAGETLGPLAGVPMAHKDLFYRSGRACHCGSKIRAGFVPDTTSTALSRLDAAGAVDLGTLHMAEFALSPTGYNEHFGHGRNPWNPAHICGGSSSGSGIAVAARAVPASLGTDTGGSVRHPAAACGLTGVKPTHGCVSLAGAMPLSATLDTVGVLTCSARDAARVMDVVSGEDPADPTTAWAPSLSHEAALTGDIGGLTIARPRGYYDDELSTEVETALNEAFGCLVGAGASGIETRAPDMVGVNAFAHLVVAVEAATLHRRWIEERPDDYADQVRARIEPGLFYGATHYLEALMRRGAMARDWLDAVLGEADAAILPAFPVAVPTIADTTEGGAEAVAATIGKLTRNTRGINYLGLPAVAIPVGFSASGLPIACQIVGRPWSEPLLLRIADAFQRMTDFHRRTPPEAVA